MTAQEELAEFIKLLTPVNSAPLLLVAAIRQQVHLGLYVELLRDLRYRTPLITLRNIEIDIALILAGHRYD